MHISPALGAMYAPLAVKFVQSGISILFSFLTGILSQGSCADNKCRRAAGKNEVVITGKPEEE